MEYKYEGGKCGFCNSTDVRKITRAVDSDMQCAKCGAVFYSPDHYDPEKASKWTGRYEELPSEKYYIDPNTKREDE